MDTVTAIGLLIGAAYLVALIVSLIRVRRHGGGIDDRDMPVP